ncbi:hypothetical protein VTJ04DRAFT_7572 [Mycothermus thermophilus]|uniref:uncharacterized protein n=1 Tax=Humicola insolens TaxID=85995 RepID=UPI003742BE90
MPNNMQQGVIFPRPHLSHATSPVPLGKTKTRLPRRRVLDASKQTCGRCPDGAGRENRGHTKKERGGCDVVRRGQGGKTIMAIKPGEMHLLPPSKVPSRSALLQLSSPLLNEEQKRRAIRNTEQLETPCMICLLLKQKKPESSIVIFNKESVVRRYLARPSRGDERWEEGRALGESWVGSDHSVIVIVVAVPMTD